MCRLATSFVWRLKAFHTLPYVPSPSCFWTLYLSPRVENVSSIRNLAQDHQALKSCRNPRPRACSYRLSDFTRRSAAWWRCVVLSSHLRSEARLSR